MRTQLFLILPLAVCATLTLLIMFAATPFGAVANAAVDTSTFITATEPISVPIRYEPRGVLTPLALIGGEIGALALDDGYAFVGQGLTVDVYRHALDRLAAEDAEGFRASIPAYEAELSRVSKRGFSTH